MASLWLEIILNAALVIVYSTQDSFATMDHSRLRESLFRNQTYDKSVRPVYDPSTTTRLELQLFLAQVLNVDERLQTLKMNVWLTIRWTDEFLMWDPADYGGIENFKIDKEFIWMPDVWLYQNADNKYEDFTLNSQCVVRSNGQVLWAAPAIIKSHCKMDVWNFPFDKQSCNVTFGPWLHNASEIYVQGTGDQSFFEGDTEWQLWELTTLNENESIRYYPDYPYEDFSKVIYVVYLKRLPTYYVFYLIMPCSLISASTILSFFLPVESGEKVGLGITVLLSLTVYLLLLAETLPPMKNNVPILGQYYAAVMFLVSLSIMMSVIVLNLHHRGPESRPVPPWLRRLVLGKVARFVLIRQVSANTDNRKINKRDQARIRKKLEFHPMIDFSDSSDGSFRVGVNGFQQARRLANHSPKPRLRKSMQASGPGGAANSKPFIEENIYFLREIIQEVKLLREMFEERQKEDESSCEWKQVALVVDRILLFIYVLSTIGCMLVIFLQIEYDDGPSPFRSSMNYIWPSKPWPTSACNRLSPSRGLMTHRR
ncbi:neuronal acetylcholine receptor subunit alpha-10-like [Ptychodera flava]|uniref:neuronal acetylcholine receptor subunit alpha-10-like n=1 Tax=Ptychodera flava TaxID=63121 RepID=UPI00396A1F6C